MTGQPLQIVLVTKAWTTAEVYSRALTSAGHTVSTATSTAEALAVLRRDGCDVLVTDARVERDDDGVQLAKEVLNKSKGVQVIVLAERPNVQDAVMLTKLGA